MTARIMSRANLLVKRVRLLASDSEARRTEGTFVAEGIRVVEDALAAGASLEAVILSPRLRLSERGRRLSVALEHCGARAVDAADTVLDSISAAENSQGVLALVRCPTPPAIGQAGGAEPFWVVAWGLRDPGNVGTLLRTAEAAGADLFLTVAGTSDPFSPKAVRASAGSVFRLPLLHALGPDEILDGAAARGVRLFGTDPSSGLLYDEPDYSGGIGFVFGRESEGLPSAVSSRLGAMLTIPMRGGVESLNVGAAAAVVLFEAARRRRAGRGGR